MRQLTFFLLLSVLFIACEKEDTKTFDPITITSEVTHVSVYGASDGAISLTVSGGSGTYSYEWSTGATTINISDIPAGSYTVTVTDSEGNSEQHNVSVNEPTELTVGFETGDESAVGAGDGSINLQITGGTAPYTISWQHGPITSELNDLSAGTYAVNVQDAAGAEKTLNIDIFAPLTLSLSATNVTSYNGSDGSVDLTIEGGQEPYQISWNSSDETEDLSSIEAGYYEVTVTDNLDNVKKLGTTVFENYDKATDEAEILENVLHLIHAGIRVEFEGKIIYIDPINAYNFSSDADIILITHNHDDHFKTSVITNLANSATTIIIPQQCYTQTVSALPSADIVVIAPDSVKTVNDIEIETVHAYNSNHAEGCVGYILNLDGVRFYHSGDTERITEMLGFNADIACLPMGQTYTFPSIEEAANAARDVGASVVVPIHYDRYEGKPSDPWTMKDLLSGEIDVVVKPSMEL